MVVAPVSGGALHAVATAPCIGARIRYREEHSDRKGHHGAREDSRLYSFIHRLSLPYIRLQMRRSYPLDPHAGFRAQPVGEQVCISPSTGQLKPWSNLAPQESMH